MLQHCQKFLQPTPWCHEKRRRMQTGAWQVLAGSSWWINTAAQTNQGVGKVPKPALSSLLCLRHYCYMKHPWQKTVEGIVENGQQAKRIQRSSLIIIRENNIPQGLSVCTDGSICRQPVTVQPGRRFAVRLRPVKTVQPTQSQPPASQCWWKHAHPEQL